MIGNLLAKFRRRSRRYHISKDAFGRSARERAFQPFGDGKRPPEVSRMVGISLRTACHYFADWKKHPEALEARYRLAAGVKKRPEMWGTLIATVSTALGVSQKEVVARFQKPWGLKQLLMGKWPNYAEERVRREREARLMIALKLITLVEESKLTPEQIAQLVRAFVEKYRPHGPR